MKLKLMSMAAMALSALLCLTTTGAWAGKLEPLTTILSADNADFTSGSKTFDNIATVTFSGNVSNEGDSWGWYSEEERTLTVTAAEGCTITGVEFYNNSGSDFVFEAPFEAILVLEGGWCITKVNGTSIGQNGVTKIEVYGNAPEPAAPAWLLEGDEWDDATKTLTVNSNTANEAYRGQTVIEHVIISSGVTSVGNAAFYECTGLTSITIGDNVTSIGTDAFYGCTGLTSVTIGNSVTSIGNEAFYGCTALTSITIPNSVTSIGTSAFYNCSALTSVTIGNSVTSIGSEAFFGCSGLTNIVVASENTTYDSRENCNAIIETSSNTLVVGCQNTIIPNSVTSIVYAFPGCTGLTSIEIPNSVTNIGDGAFFNCSGLTSVTIPNDVTSIGMSAFAGCTALESVTIPNSVTSIGMGAFGLCSGLTSVTNCAVTPQTLNSYAFYNVNTSSCTLYVPAESVSAYSAADCWKEFGNIQAIPAPEPANSCGDGVIWELNDGALTISYTGTGTGVMDNYDGEETYAPWVSSYESITSVIISNGVTSIGDVAFFMCSSLASITIPNSVTSIGMGAFLGCTGLTSITIPSSVTSIGMGAFQSCEGLPSIEIPNSVTSIGGAAFYGCTNLTSVTIGNSVTSIGDAAFCYCSNLETVTINAESLESYGAYAFEGTAEGLKIYVPAGSVDTYKTAWADDADKIEAIPAPVAPAWLLDGDEWDDATKTLTVNSNLPGNAYANNTEIEHVIINNGVTSIGEAAFAECSGLTSVTIPEGVTSIGNAAFYLCSGMTSVTIPSSVTSIGNLAFRYCSGLETVTINAESLETYGTNAFQGTAEGLKIYVPAESVADYKAAENWADYEDKIVAIPGDEPSGPHGECGAQGNNVVWSLNTATGVLTISGTGAMADYESVEEQPWKDYRSTITSVVVEEGVTTIGTTAFDGCSGLTSVTIPNSVTSIGGGAFYGCTGLTSVAIPNSVTSIGVGAFEECTGLTSVTIPNSVTSIGNRAFSYCSGLTSIIIPNSVTIIGEDVFNGCSGLTSIEIPNSVTSIGWCAFFGCEGLTSITIPNSVEYIGEGAFFGCTNITDVYCYPSAADLTWNEEDCNDFKDDGSTECHVLANQLAAYQEKFTGVVNVTFVGDLPPAWLLDGDDWDYATKTLTVNSNLPGNAYANNTEIEHVIINNGVTSIGEAAFAECSGLTSVTIPEGVTSIGNAAFYLCSGMTSVTIPSSVTSIGNLAFRYCSGLETVTINAESLETYGTNAFQGTAEGLKIYVPAESVADYKAAENWAAYADKIVAIATPAPAEPVAQSYEAKVFDAPASWAEDETKLSAADLPEDFVQITKDEAKALAVPDDGVVFLIYGFNGVNVKMIEFISGNYNEEYESPADRANIRMIQTDPYNAKICYTAAASPAPAGYSVSLKEGTEDASKWQGKAGTGEYQVLPLEGVAAGMAVSVKYIGTKKVKSVKAVKKAAPAPAAPAAKAAAAATAEDKGKLICTEGHIHAYGEDAECTADRVAKIIYIGDTGHGTYNHGLALALTDEGQMAWQAAIDACSAKNTSTPVTGATWLLASKAQWDYMLGDNGAGSNDALRTGFESVGGSNLQSDGYRSSTEANSDCAWFYYFDDGNWYDGDKGNDYLYVRACLAF